MWRRDIISLSVVALWASLAVAGQPEAVDPNEAWNPAAHLAGDWTGVSVSARIDQDANVPERFITVAASIAVTDADSLLGLNQIPTSLLALDPKAQQVCSTQPTRDRTYSPPKTTWVTKAGQRVRRFDPYAVSVNIPLDPNRACPVLLSRLEWSMYALVAGMVANVDIPLKASNRWETLAPGLWARIEKAKITGAAYEYSLKLKYNPRQVRVMSIPATLTLGGGWKSPTAILSGVHVRNARGEVIENQSNYGSLDTVRSDSIEATGAYSGKGTCTSGDTAATIRFVLALNPYEKEARLTVTNVPIPIPLLGTQQVPAGEMTIPSVDERERQGLRAAADPNRIWDQAAHLVEGWTSVTQTLRVDRNSLTYWHVLVDCAFTIIDPNGLLGFASSPVDGILAVDENARVFYSSHSQVGGQSHYRPLQYIKTRTAEGQYVSEPGPYRFRVTIPLNPKRACPVMISRLEVSTYALIAGGMKNVDLPFQASPQWVDVAPGLQALVEKADVTGTRYEYSIAVKYSPNQVDLSPLSYSLLRGSPSEVIVTKIDILDVQGRSIPDHSSGVFSNRSNYGSRTAGGVTLTGSGDCQLCGGATTIRFVLALDSYERETRLVLQNIPVPILW